MLFRSDPLRFDAIVGGSTKRVLTHKGIEYEGLFYNSPDMLTLRQQLGNGIEVEVRFNRSNLGSVIVLHPERGTPFRVPCLRSDYAEGLTQWQHDVCKRYTRETRRKNANPDEWRDSLLEISDLVADEMKLGRRKGASRDRVGRWAEGKQLPSQAAPSVASVPESRTPFMDAHAARLQSVTPAVAPASTPAPIQSVVRSEEHTSELQSH